MCNNYTHHAFEMLIGLLRLKEEKFSDFHRKKKERMIRNLPSTMDVVKV